ncbi:MAG TPA: DUF1289 domain-containing protein [Caulobacteraceae bacterium]|jgi:hypothetical protein|nr:DUF1289 domain-containing protein [Caulobacteraceae bacterium]
METKAPQGQTIVTPCIKICVVDGESGLCIGCFRSLPEVGRWGGMSDAERAEVMAGLADRRGRIRPEKLAMFHSA